MKDNWFLIIFVSILLWFAVVATSCRTIQVVPEVHKEYIHDTISRVDSVWRDRVHTEYMRGDTIILRDSVYLYQYKTIDKIVEVTRRDSIPYAVEVEKQVRYVPGFYKFCLWFFIGVVVVFVLWLLMKIGNAIYLRK